MKRVLFVVSNLGCGGINRALENLTAILEKSHVKITVFAFDTTGQYHDGFTGASLMSPTIVSNYLTRILSEQKGVKKALSALFKTIDRVSGGRLNAIAKKQELRRIANADFDAVIAFSEGLPTHFLANLDADNKIAWIHCDFKSYLSFCTGNAEKEIDAYTNFKNIICVSDFTKRSFEEVSSNKLNNVLSIPNVLDISMMKRKALDFSPEFKGAFNIVTVGRIDPVKRPSVIPQILSDILKTAPNVHRYIIGPTIWRSEYEKLQSEIYRCGVDKNIHLLGQRNNPYPYIKNADLLVNTSVSEACPYVVNEAKVLGTPVVCTDFGSAAQFVTNGKDGFSVPLEKMASTISDIIADSEIYRRIKDNLKGFEYDNDAIKTQFLSLV